MSAVLLLWRYANLERGAVADTTAPAYAAGEIGDTNTVTVEVTFSETITAAGSDFSSGVTIQINSVDAVIESGSLQGDGRTVYYALATAADINDVVTFEYDSATGNITDSSGNAMGDITAQTVVNYVGSHYWFFDFNCSGHLVTLGV